MASVLRGVGTRVVAPCVGVSVVDPCVGSIVLPMSVGLLDGARVGASVTSTCVGAAVGAPVVMSPPLNCDTMSATALIWAAQLLALLPMGPLMEPPSLISAG
jgi:hypothetical protein